MSEDDEDRSFGAVEEKLAETEFFLRKLRGVRQLSAEGPYFFSAFVSAARSVTWAMQASLNHVDGFPAWYETVQRRLQTDALARFFVQTRNVIQKRGHNPFDRVDLDHLVALLNCQLRGHRRPILMVPDPKQPKQRMLSDAVEVCEQYFNDLVTVVWECYDKYRTVVDARWYFTQENFRQQNKSLQDALAEMGFPPTWFGAIPDADEVQAWRVIRSQQPGCGINHLFLQYLGKEMLGPDDEAPSSEPDGAR